MVRKRTRRQSRYLSEDNDSDSDADFAVEEILEPAPKKYSLRERKAPVLTSDFDYYGLDEEEEAQSSDDEDFQVEDEIDNTLVVTNIPPSKKCDDYDKPAAEPVPVGQEEAEEELVEEQPMGDPESSDGLIDFEDIIRADIVVNRNRIDYDNLIQKTEIKFNPPATQKRRGRRSKNQINYEETETQAAQENGDTTNMNNSVEPETEQAVQSVENDHNSNDNDPDNLPDNIFQPEVSVTEGASSIITESPHENNLKTSVQANDELQNNDLAETNNSQTILHVKDKEIAPNPPAIPSPPLVIVPQAAPDRTSVEKPSEIDGCKVEDKDDEDDDVIIVGELPQEVIVLDD